MEKYRHPNTITYSSNVGMVVTDLLVGSGNDRFLRSACHGAGRARSRFDMSRAGADKTDSALGLTGVDCITWREERRIEEAPAAYKPIQPVIDVQVEAQIVGVVAEMKDEVRQRAMYGI